MEGKGVPDFVPFSWNEAENALRSLSKRVSGAGLKPDIIVGISRGGLVPARLLSDFLGISNLQVITASFYTGVGRRAEAPRITNSRLSGVAGSSVLLVDDISDTGKSFAAAAGHVLSLSPSSLKTLSIHMKKTSSFRPDFFFEESAKWIVYPWEKEEFFRDTGIRVD